MVQKIKEHSNNKLNNFIKGFYINKKVCKNLIDYFNSNKHLHSVGKLSTGYIPEDKKSTDMAISLDSKENCFLNYIEELNECSKKYRKIYDSLDKNISNWTITEKINIQKYKKGEAFFAWHCERDALGSSSKRLLVFMTYLNTVKKGGETEWLYQKLKIKPEEGLTVIWPADWMFTHKGCPSFTEEKYIITGWYSFI